MTGNEKQDECQQKPVAGRHLNGMRRLVDRKTDAAGGVLSSSAGRLAALQMAAEFDLEDTGVRTLKMMTAKDIMTGSDTMALMTPVTQSMPTRCATPACGVSVGALLSSHSIGARFAFGDLLPSENDDAGGH